MITVCTSGWFDPMHVGHMRLFREARALGDRLIVILNSDETLLMKKHYFFLPFDERKEILRGIRYIDDVVDCIDRDFTVCKTLERLKPSIFAKGGDYKPENLPELLLCKRLGIRVVYNVGGGKVKLTGRVATYE
ncbi:MAG TPA: adenylyltransferase/cytidyltransferase family protein [Syntrophales bacterium]|nr:adenylyltransferase/cytidyltransferase family protein [Syntrophales bacterium]HRT62104.1 adenylyltransferase/cytidyltransferase family protein [Syntrophales bacterium]